MTFDYKNQNNRTPRPQDFAEDTYHTLTVVDSVGVDCVKAVEEQTETHEVACRNTPVMILWSKMDREGKDRFSF
jgi:peptide chain release factor 3